MDEVHLKRNLVLHKRTGRLIGYVKLTELDQEFAALQQTFSKICESSGGIGDPSASNKPPLAEKMLTYMATNIATGVHAVVACYGVHNVMKEKLYELTWDVIGTIERCDLPVIAIVCDGAAINRAFYHMHPPATKTASGVVFDTINIYAPHRLIYFISDAPHLLKTCRNCLYYSGKRNKKKGLIREMTKNGIKMEWKSAENYFNKYKGDFSRLVYKLNQEDVYLTPYSKMRVSLAAHV